MEISTQSFAADSYLEKRPIPKGWGDTELTKFLRLLEEQALATFAGLRPWFDVLIRVDQSLTERASTFFHEIDAPRRTSSKLFMRSFSTYRAAVRLSVSGQLFEATVLMRSILEGAVYGWVCAGSDEHRKAWESRGVNDAERKVARSLFAWGGLLKHLQASDGALAERIADEYEHLIDQGAHPNVEGLALSSETKALGNDKYEIITIFAHGRDAVLVAILDLLRCMDYVWKLLYMVIKERLQILGLDGEFQKTSTMIYGLIVDLEEEQRREQP